MKLNHILPGTISVILAARPFVICIDPCQTGLIADYLCEFKPPQANLSQLCAVAVPLKGL